MPKAAHTRAHARAVSYREHQLLCAGQSYSHRDCCHLHQFPLQGFGVFRARQPVLQPVFETACGTSQRFAQLEHIHTYFMDYFQPRAFLLTYACGKALEKK